MNKRPPLRIVTDDELPTDPWGSNKGHAPTTIVEREFGTYVATLGWEVEVVPTPEAVAILVAGGKADASLFFQRRVGPGPILVEESWLGQTREPSRPLVFTGSSYSFDDFGALTWDIDVDAYLLKREFGTVNVRVVITGAAIEYSFENLDVRRRSFSFNLQILSEDK
jgi:hypothetical protein